MSEDAHEPISAVAAESRQTTTKGGAHEEDPLTPFGADALDESSGSLMLNTMRGGPGALASASTADVRRQAKRGGVVKDVLLSPEMAIARRLGRKTQTRRVMKPQPVDDDFEVGFYWPTRVNKRTGEEFPGKEVFGIFGDNWDIPCPYGAPGDQIRWLTTWAVAAFYDERKPSLLPNFFTKALWSYHDSDHAPLWCGKLRPGRFLPGHLRHLMPVDTIKSIRVERLQDISEADAIKEGVEPKVWKPTGETGWRNYDKAHGFNLDAAMCKTARQSFETLFNLIKGHGSWDANPWVWVVEFEGSAWMTLEGRVTDQLSEAGIWPTAEAAQE